MPVSTAEIRQLLRRWLLDDPELSDAVDGVFGSHLSSSDAETVLRERPIVVFDFVGGSGRAHRELEQPLVEVYVITRGPADAAFRVYDLVYRRLASERIKVSGIGPCGTARESERPSDGRYEALAARYVKALWVVTAIAGPEV